MWGGAGNQGGHGGAGDPSGIVSSGTGDPFSNVTYADVRVVYTNLVWESLEENSTNNREAAPLVFNQQGGELVDLIIQTGYSWPETTYNIRLISVLGQSFPEGKPGCFGAMEGYGSVLYPMYGNTVLRFSLPRAPLGVYNILISSADQTVSLSLNKAIRLAPSPTSFEVNRYRTFFNPEVYSKRGPLT